MHLREFLSSPLTHLPPDKALDGLDPELATAHVPGAPHSIAEVVAHMAFWQDWFYARCTGNAVPMVGSAAAGWPAVTTDAWPTIRSQFLERLEQLASLSDGDVLKPVQPPIEFPPIATYTIGAALTHVATHNAHHPRSSHPAAPVAGCMATARRKLDLVTSAIARALNLES